jgi:hypothetical protein
MPKILLRYLYAFQFRHVERVSIMSQQKFPRDGLKWIAGGSIIRLPNYSSESRRRAPRPIPAVALAMNPSIAAFQSAA